ncbi:hypothetical protein OESDEN_13032 [Oesophagostomum dentatum]|uniref:Uncharacterized protein n=1 Tax=Oesophagostomum dentatum TaxID=61180 RepID=A0A0B1SUL5_OESDE|nr:hypothetical protein OESDEN_13032 [Oesophagostomum dentatum]
MTGHDFLANLPEGVSACPFLEHGCHKAGADMEVKLHIRDDRIYHLVLLCRAVIELRRARIEILRHEPDRIARLDKQVIPADAIVKKYG